MKYITGIFVILISLFLPQVQIQAASGQAYTDYLYQNDQYRTAYNQFRIAKDEYEKFKTLTSQNTALEKTKTMLEVRDQFLKSYLNLLNEKINENQGMSGSDKQLYQTLLTNENTFLDSHKQLIPSIGTISDAMDVSRQLESHYSVLQTSMRQIIIGLSLGNLAYLSRAYDTNLQSVMDFFNNNRNALSMNKSATIERWFVTIRNKKFLYQQKYDQINQINAGYKSDFIDDIDRKFNDIQKQIGEAKVYLQEGSSYMSEVINILKFMDN